MEIAWKVLCGISALALLSCARPAPTPVFAEGTLSPAHPDLRRLAKSGFSKAALRPDVSLASYDAIHLMYPNLRYRTPPRYSASEIFGQDNYSLGTYLTRDFKIALDQIFGDELTGANGWRPNNEPGADDSLQTLDIEVSLVDLVVHVPLARLPDSSVAWTESIGEVTVAIDLYDAPSRRLIARFAERRKIAPVSGRPAQARRGAAQYEARRIFRLWARSLRLALEAIEAADVRYSSSGQSRSAVPLR